jgi:DNA-directed RNA polymerase specialized sigma24 family protein
MLDERTLIDRIRAGDTDAWHTFIERYSPRIRKTIHRYIDDPEVERDLYASLLEKLDGGKLERFDGRASLSTWLFAVARNHCRDYYRSAKGIRHVFTAIEGLGDAERRFFKLHYLQGLSLQATFESMRTEAGGGISYLDIFDYREAVRKVVAGKHLGRLLDRLLRPESGLCEFASLAPDLRFDREETLESTTPSPEAHIDARNLGIAIENLRKAILRLPYRDQLILKLRFEHKRSAREIGDILDLGKERQVYRKLDNLFEELRTMLLECDLPPDTYREVVGDIESLCAYSGVWGAELPPGSKTAS